MKSVLLALQFLTIIPVPIRGRITERDVGRSAAFFPLAGMVQGLAAAAAASGLAPFFPSGIVAAMAILVLILTNGGFHLDGLADTFDALAVKSSGDASADRIKRLAVMKDSATGAIGVVSIVVCILLKYVFITEAFDRYHTESAVYLLFLMPVFSRWVMTTVVFHTRSARIDGLGKVFIDQARIATILVSGLLVVALFAGASYAGAFLGPRSATKFLLLILVSLYAFSLLWVAFCARRFGGSTGDTIGAAAEVGELLFLMIALAWF
jgi:adenosylcobinamide-GDP ribazoletransferase